MTPTYRLMFGDEPFGSGEAREWELDWALNADEHVFCTDECIRSAVLVVPEDAEVAG